MTGVVDEPCRPILCSSLPLVTPANARSTMNAREVLAVDLGEDDEEVGEAAVGDPHLLAVQDEAAVGLRGRRASSRRARRSRSRARSGSRRRRSRRSAAAAGTCASAPRCRTATAAAPSGWPARRTWRRTTPTCDIRSLTIIDVTLSSSTPPYASGDVDAEQAELAAALHEVARQRPVLLLEPVEHRQHLVVDEVGDGLARSAGAPRSAAPGVKTSAGSVGCSSHSPPRRVGAGDAVVGVIAVLSAQIVHRRS